MSMENKSLDLEGTLETWPVDRVKPYPGNPRKIGDDAVAAVARSIEMFGWQQPIVVDNEGVIVVGHTRFKAAKSLGYTEVPVSVSPLSGDKLDEYRLADNRVGEMSQWDPEALAVEVREFDDDFVEEFFPDVDMEISTIEEAREEYTEEEIEKGSQSAQSMKPVSDGVTHTTDVECPSCVSVFQVRTTSLPGISEALVKELMGDGGE